MRVTPTDFSKCIGFKIFKFDPSL